MNMEYDVGTAPTRRHTQLRAQHCSGRPSPLPPLEADRRQIDLCQQPSDGGGQGNIML